MSTINPNTLYSQNQGIFDSRPYMAFAQRLNQERSAREEATNKYYQDLPNRINGAGLDDGDVEGLNNRVNKIKQFWMQNAAQIKKGTTPENYNYQKLIREAQGYTEQGKNKVKDLVAAGVLRNQKGNEYLNDDEEFTNTLTKAALPLDKGYEGINMATLVKPLRPYDPIQHQREIKSFVPTTFDIEVERDPNDNTKDIQHKIPKYSSEDFTKIGLGAANRYAKNRSYKKEVDDIIANPVARQSANELYKKYFKKDAETPQDFAVAFDISVAMPKAESVDRVVNGQRKFDAANAENDRRAARNQSYKRANILLNQSAVSAGLGINDVYNKIDENQQNGDIDIPYTKNGVLVKRIKGARFNALPNDAQQIIMPALKAVDKFANLTNVYTIKEDDGSIGIYKTDENNRPIPSIETRITTISRTGINLKAQPDAKSKKAVVAQGEPNRKSSNNSVKSKQKISW